jgi:hypothetical protein
MNKTKSKLKKNTKIKNKNKSKLRKNTKIKRKNHRSYKSKMVGGALPIKVISYNISWGAMSGDENDGTAAYLAEHCYNANIANIDVRDETACLSNVRLFLEAEYDKGKRLVGPEADIGFIALQEAMHWDTIICRSDRLSNMGYVHHAAKFNSQNREIYADLCTLYNPDRFKLLGVICGNINKTNQDGRPYHKLFFQTTTQPIQKFIFINLHNSHEHIIRDIPQLEQALNDPDPTVIDVHETTEIHFENIDENDFARPTLNNFIQTHRFLENSHIIMAGDTNDHGGINFWQGITPFIQTPGLDTIQVNTKTIQPPLTCCVGQYGLRLNAAGDTNYGDYIMISQNLNYGLNNFIPLDFNRRADENPTSDHLPVVAIIT